MTGLYNTSGRGVPDVAAQGAQFVVVFQSSFESVSGTSAAVPTFSGIVRLCDTVETLC